MKVQRDLAAKGQVLVSTYEQLWLPVLGDLPDTTYHGQERYSAQYGSFGPLVNHPFHGALAFTPNPGVPLPDTLTSIQEWQAASARLDLNARVVTIQVEDTAITFTAINVNLKPHELLREINRGLVRARAGVSGKYQVVLSKEPRVMSQNLPGHLLTVENRQILGPNDDDLWPDLDALGWHRQNVFFCKCRGDQLAYSLIRTK